VSFSEGGMPLNLMCNGTEPFWSLEFAQDESGSFTIAGQEGGHDFQLGWTGTSRNIGLNGFGFSSPELAGTLRRAECSDGMSDLTYGWSVDILFSAGQERQLYSGCCAGR